MGQIKVDSEIIQETINTVSVSITNTDSYLTHINTLTGTASANHNTLPSSLSISPINLSAPTNTQPDIFGKMESATLRHIQTICAELGTNANEEITNTITTMVSHIQTAKNIWIQTDEEIAEIISE